MKFPRLKFKPNLALDIDMGTEFLNVQGGGVDFGQNLVRLYPSLAKAKSLEDYDKRRDEVIKFTTKYYKLHKNTLKLRSSQFNENWKKVGDDFFKAVESIFGTFPWPEGEYICYLSIFDSNPRFLENKTFQLFYRYPQWGNHIIAHEMLHFIFFSYLDTKEAKFKDRLDEGTIWLLSEFFNDIILELPQFNKFRSNDDGAYPEVREFAKRFKGKFKGKIDVTSFFQVSKTIL